MSRAQLKVIWWTATTVSLFLLYPVAESLFSGHYRTLHDRWQGGEDVILSVVAIIAVASWITVSNAKKQ